MFSKRFFVIVFVFVFVFIFVFLPSLWSKVSRIALWWCSQNVFVFNVVFIFVMGSYLSFCWSNLSKCLKKSQTSRMKQDVLYLHGILFIQIKVQDKIRYLGHDGSQPDYIYMMTMVIILKMSTFAGMAVAGIVNSLWDLRGRIEGKPVGQWFVAHNDQTIVMMSCRCGESWQNSAPRSKSSSLISRNMSSSDCGENWEYVDWWIWWFSIREELTNPSGW